MIKSCLMLRVRESGDHWGVTFVYQQRLLRFRWWNSACFLCVLEPKIRIPQVLTSF